MRTSIAHLVGARPWALDRRSPAFAELGRLAAGHEVEIDIEAFEAREKSANEALAKNAGTMRDMLGTVRVGAVDVIPVFNVITQRYSWLTWLMDGTALDWLNAAIRESIEDTDVAAVILDIDSPGGSVDGLIEFCADFRTYAATAASGAVGLWSGATEYVCTPSGSVGSIGVYAMHVDMSGAMTIAGLAVTYIHYGEYKVEGNPYEPLSEEPAAQIQLEVDYSGRKFEADVAKGRGVAASVVHEQFGQGRMLLPEAAQAVGLVDRIDTLANTVKRYQRGAAAIGRSARSASPELIAKAIFAELMGSDQTDDPGQPVAETPAADATETASGAPESATDDTASASADDDQGDDPAANDDTQGATTEAPEAAAGPTPLFTQRDVEHRKAAGIAAFDRAVRGPEPRPWFERSLE